MDAKSLRTLKPGDPIQFARGTKHGIRGQHAKFLRVIPCDPHTHAFDMIEFEFKGETHVLLHDRFTRAKFPNSLA